ncbi:MAG: hypothetical protein ACYDHO_03395 [Gaiellaceae bacterium]
MKSRPHPLILLDLLMKTALFGLLAVAVAFPDLAQFEGKAMLGRAIGYPIAVLIVRPPSGSCAGGARRAPIRTASTS